MRYSGTWLTPEDEALLEVLREAGPASPAELAARDVVDYSGALIAERCSLLAGRGRLVAFTDGRYGLTGRGEAYLDGELDSEALERSARG